MADPILNEQSEYTSDFLLFDRLGRLCMMADMEAKQLKIYPWFHTILAIYREIAPTIKQEDRAEYENLIKEITPRFMRIQDQINKTGSFTLDAALYLRLQYFEIKLRDCMKKAGFYLKTKQDSSFGFTT